VFPISEKQPVRIIGLYVQIEALGLGQQGESYYEWNVMHLTHLQICNILIFL